MTFCPSSRTYSNCFNFFRSAQVIKEYWTVQETRTSSVKNYTNTNGSTMFDERLFGLPAPTLNSGLLMGLEVDLLTCSRNELSSTPATGTRDFSKLVFKYRRAWLHESFNKLIIWYINQVLFRKVMLQKISILGIRYTMGIKNIIFLSNILKSRVILQVVCF